MKRRRIIVIGGGPAGMMAAGQAALLGGDVILLEKMKRPGRKLSITGKGRCNLTNTSPKEDFIRQFGPNGRFLHQAFARFFSDDLIAFFDNLGLKTERERGGRIFPADNRAQDIVTALTTWLKKTKAVVKSGLRVNELMVEKGRITGVRAGKLYFPADRVVIATGGKSYPATGSTGDGYRLAEALGHTVVPAQPALVPLETDGDVAMQLNELTLKNVKIKVLIDGRKKHEAFGEMSFAYYGLTGPIILTLSRYIVAALHDKKGIVVTIDLKPALDNKKLDNRLLREIDQNRRKQYYTLLKNLLPKKLIPVCIEQTGIAYEKKIDRITAEERKKLRLWLKDFRFDIIGHRGFDEAIITSGGVSLKEIDPRTMASRMVKGLHFAGEILDLDGATGGYNLQAAFSTGYLAGRAAMQ